MTFIALNFYIFLIVLLVLYYIIPIRYRWIVLLVGSLGFYYVLDKGGIIRLAAAIIISYFAGILIEHARKNGFKPAAQKLILFCGICTTALPLLIIKGEAFLNRTAYIGGVFATSLGIAFYTLQIISYLADIYKNKICAQKNLAKYALYVSFFPQIVQGPIPRYERLGKQLFEGHYFKEETFTKGIHLIIWGFFLKLMIADKAGIVVDTVFNEFVSYKGAYVLFAGILYSIQLYADFQACVCLARGVSLLFGIYLDNNFNHPYFSQSIKEFWRRWHISLSSWLKDYVYIPLGGSRKGIVRKWVNLFIVFFVSGIWHGSGFRYIFWGLMHAAYQLVGALTEKLRSNVYKFLGFKPDSNAVVNIKRICTFLFAMLAWIIFRANSLREGISMIISIFTVWNPWIFFNDSLFGLGLDWKEMCVLIISIAVFIKVSLVEERKVSVSDIIFNQPVLVRWGVYVAAIVIIMVFGTYGYGFDAQNFIYGSF